MFGLFSKKPSPEPKNNTGYVITNPFGPVVELLSSQGARNYASKIGRLSSSDLCIELANVRAAKHNVMNGYAGPNDRDEKQALVSDLNDKALTICIKEFGRNAVLGFCGDNLRLFNDLLDNLDDVVAGYNLEPAQHGHRLLNDLRKVLLSSK